ncbi:MAG TPA: glutamate--cysteine ligase, partial [Rhodospirillaceae bacterium]|nr:glutamate--cysteine ligase [Rhodospirillaceae bacterium]
MSSPTASDETLVESKSQLIDYIASGEKPQADWRIGTEHEKFLFCTDSHRPLAYEGRPGVKGLLEALSGP